MSGSLLSPLPPVLGPHPPVLLTSFPSVLPLGLFTSMCPLLGTAFWLALSFPSGLAQFFIFEACDSVPVTPNACCFPTPLLTS